MRVNASSRSTKYTNIIISPTAGSASTKPQAPKEHGKPRTGTALSELRCAFFEAGAAEKYSAQAKKGKGRILFPMLWENNVRGWNDGFISLSNIGRVHNAQSRCRAGGNQYAYKGNKGGSKPEFFIHILRIFQTECAANTAAADINNYTLPYAVYSKSKKGGLAVVFALSADEKDAVKAP